MMPLGLLRADERAEVIEVKGGGHAAGAAGRARDMGLGAGQEVEVLHNAGRGPLLLKVGDARIAVGRGMAMKIMVRRTA